MDRFVTVYCASSNEVDNKYLDAAEEIGKALALRAYSVIYGGGKVGLMGRIASGMLINGGKVNGVIPEFMTGLELQNTNVTELHIVKDMHERQRKMMMDSDAIIALPGGSGTMMELFEAISWKRLGLIVSPIIIFNQDGYYDALIELLDTMVEEKFMKGDYALLWEIAYSVDEVIEILNNKLNLRNSISLMTYVKYRC